MSARKWFIVALGAISLAGCNAAGQGTPDPRVSGRDAEFLARAPKAAIPSEFERYQVNYRTSEPVGSIVVDSPAHYLYYILPGGKAIRYGVATGQGATGGRGRA